jgi:hypothetical protein
MSSKWTWVWVLGCAGMAGLATTRVAADTDPADANPYSVISDRNVFHLNPPPPPPPPVDPTPVELPKVMLTGFIKKHDIMEVLLAVSGKDTKEKQESIVYLTLTPGEKQHDVELVKVRYDKEEVDIVNSGTLQTLSVKSNSYASTAAPPPAAHGAGAPPMPGGLPGFGHRSGLPMRNMPPIPGRPSAAATPSGSSAIIAGGGGGSAIVSGGAGGAANASSPFGSFGSLGSGGVSVSGGSPNVPIGAAPGTMSGGAAEQIATSLFNQQNGQYVKPTPTEPPAPPEVQGKNLLVQKLTMGGPPLPPNLQEMLDGGPPEPPPPGSQ